MAKKSFLPSPVRKNTKKGHFYRHFPAGRDFYSPDPQKSHPVQDPPQGPPSQTLSGPQKCPNHGIVPPKTAFFCQFSPHTNYTQAEPKQNPPANRSHPALRAPIPAHGRISTPGPRKRSSGVEIHTRPGDWEPPLARLIGLSHLNPAGRQL